MKKRIIKISCVTIIMVMLALVTYFMYNYYKYREVSIELSEEYTEYFRNNTFDEREIINEYTSDVTVCYLNEDGSKSLYVFSKPVNYLEPNFGIYIPIDTRIVNVTNGEMRSQGYIYTVASNNIVPYYPKELSNDKGILIESSRISYEIIPNSDKKIRSQYINEKNFIDEKKNMISYDLGEYEMSFYPSSLGTNVEVDAKESTNQVSFKIPKQKGVKMTKQPGEYLTLVDEKSNVLGIIQKPLIKFKNNYSYDGEVDFTEEKDYYEVVYSFEELKKKSKVFISFEVIQDQQPDNAIYSNIPNLNNAFLCNYSVIGQSDKFGIGRLMIRFVINKVFEFNPEDISSVNYNVYCLNPKEKSQMDLYTINEDWCSIWGNWKSNYSYGPDIVSSARVKDNTYSFDITDSFKLWCDDDTCQLEHNGLLMRASEETSSSIFLSNDNSLFYTYTEIVI